MRLAELSARTDLSTATIKYYVRVGLLPPGESQSSTWASYDESHVRRLRLVRALTEVAGMSLDEVRGVVEAVHAAGSEHQVRGAAQWSLAPTVTQDPSTASLSRVDALLARHGWQVAAETPHRRVLAAALDTLDELEFAASDEILDAYVRALEPVADLEIARVAGAAEPDVEAERIVIGTLLYEPVLLTLRRLAHEAGSGRPG